MIAPDPAPLRALRAALQQARAQGIPFEAAWTGALAGLEGDWLDILAEHREVWRAAYGREPITAISAIAALAVGDEPSDDMRRSAPPVTSRGARHDGTSELETVQLPWCH